MKKTILLNLLLLFGVSTAFAQKQDIKELYFDYTQSRMNEDQNALTVEKANSLLERSSELNDKQVANVSFHLARIYESMGKPEKAEPLYEKVTKLVPGYYVTYTSLGFINLKKCDTLGRKVSESAKLKNAALNEIAFKAYKIQVQKTIQYFEKAEACETDERTLSILTSLYKSIKDTTSLASFAERKALLGKDCVSLLDDE
ncbi:tetratricopeptide repeat protein [Pedobacter sp. WC2423]|uniref:tetratricopeptide repeat protein n=1 Tax=Pedobacter sp. WC2423 TaxID=3234142 RepID=UPI0034670A3A